MARWRPVLVFSRQHDHRFRQTIDTFDTGPPEKDWSWLQQTVQGTRWLLEHLSDPGAMVVDCCMGTGTTAVAVLTASDGPRTFIGCDRDEEMVKIARHRVSTAIQEARVKNEKVLEDLRIYIEDATDAGMTQADVLGFWERFSGLSRSQFPHYLALLPVPYQAMWSSLAA